MNSKIENRLAQLIVEFVLRAMAFTLAQELAFPSSSLEAYIFLLTRKSSNAKGSLKNFGDWVIENDYTLLKPEGTHNYLCLQDRDWRRKWQPTPVFLPGKSHGRRSLVGYSPWGHKESDMTE